MQHCIFSIRTTSDGHLYFYALVICLSLCYVSITMFLVYRKVHHVEKEGLKYSFARYSKSKKENMKMSRRVMIQGILYSAALFLTCISFILIEISEKLSKSYTVEILNSIFFPLQGFLNAAIYLIPISQQLIRRRRESIRRSFLERQQNPSGASPWLTTSIAFMNRFLQSKEGNKSSSDEKIDIQSEQCKQGGILDRYSGVFVPKESIHASDIVNVNDKQEEQMVHLDSSSNKSKTKKEAKIIGEIKDEENANSVKPSPLLYVEEEEEQKPPSLALYQNSELRTEMWD